MLAKVAFKPVNKEMIYQKWKKKSLLIDLHKDLNRFGYLCLKRSVKEQTTIIDGSSIFGKNEPVKVVAKLSHQLSYWQPSRWLDQYNTCKLHVPCHIDFELQMQINVSLNLTKLYF